ncbi:MAG: T9SS type A sorting domain-containing protein [Candidatus Zixiibacteriota bacterium]|nr:MAG: T9SS type A sorting domain-containing protein [candidate division Zixibacteria bacterium]
MRTAIIFSLASFLLLAGNAFAFDPLFCARIDYAAGDGPYSVFAADFNADGNNDLAVANPDSDSISVFLNNGNGTFQAAVNYRAGHGPSSAFAIDLDGDGFNDLANIISILINLSKPAGVYNSPETSLPGSLSILQNYPDPFNVSTAIGYGLPDAGHVKNDIYDQPGRRIETLKQGRLPAGYHQVIWNASEFSSGVYFYRIEAGGFVETGKMILLK